MSDYQKKFRWRRWIAVLVIVLVLAAAVWQGVERYLDIERYLPLITAQIHQQTGLPAVIGSADLRLFPMPHLSVFDIIIGEGDFKAEATSISVRARLSGLLRRELDIASIEAEDLIVTLPDNSADVQRRVQDLLDHLKSEEPTPAESESTPAAESGKGKPGISVGGFALRIGRIVVPKALLRQGSQEMTRCSIAVDDVLSDRIRLDLSAALPFLGPEARLAANLSMDQSIQDAPLLEGSAKVEHFDIEDLVGNASVPHTTIGLEAKFSGTPPSSIHADLSGTLHTDISKAFSGAIQGKAAWSEGALTLQDAALTAPGLDLKAEARFVPGGDMRITIPSAACNGEGLRVLLALVPIPGYALKAQKEGAFTLSNIVAGSEKGGEWKVLSGTIEGHGVDLLRADGAVMAANITGSIETVNNALHIKELKSGDLKISGDIRPDLTKKTIALDLNGAFSLANPLVTAFLPKDTVRDLDGACAVKQIKCTIVPGKGLPDDLKIEGNVTSGKLGIVTPAYQDKISDIAVAFTSDGKRVEGKASASSEHYGTVKGTGQYTLADQTIGGTVSLDLPRAALSFVTSESTRPYAEAVFKAFGPSTFDVTYQPKKPQDGRMYLAVKRQGAPSINATLYFDQKKEGLVLDQLDLDSEIPLDSLQPVIPGSIHATGPAALHMTGGYGKGGFSANLDLQKTIITAGEYLEKKIDAPLSVQVALGNKTSPFAPVSASIRFYQEQIQVMLDGPSPNIPNLQVNLAPLSELLAKGGKASGKVSGSIETQPFSVALHLDNTGFTFAPDAAIDSMSGDISYANENWACKNLSIRGADSDALINASLSNRQIDATVTGSKLNLNAIEALYTTFASLSKSPSDTKTAPAPAPAPASPSAAPSQRITGKGVVDVQSLYYRRAQLNRVHTDLLFAQDSLDMNALSFGYGTGTVKGTVRVLYGTPNTLNMDLNFQQMDLKLLDDLMSQEPQGFRGATSGPVKLSMPLASGQELYRGINGALDLNAEKGSYGKHGYATKLLAVLKSTEVLRLRIPSLKDEGLTFQKSGLKLAAQNGRMTIEKFTLNDPAYAMEGSGLIDLPGDSMDVSLGLNLLEAVTGIVDVVPVVGQVLDVLKSGTGFRIRATGSPFDPKVRLEPGVLPIGKEKAPVSQENNVSTPSSPSPPTQNPPKKKGPAPLLRGLLDDVLRQ
ncbi:MAG TPA: AsmA-like C-terminal domain-containing protein [Candidatus Hydrogenedentes bacterium]|nr:AsmA-like C-terminal domain-containing protein [Candidatus Hydrogenedentota bacterium]